MPPNMPEPGSVLLGKYRLERILGKGGMGVVALAHHLQLDQPFAIKFLLPEVLNNEQVVKRFLREAQAAVRLKSEHVCRVQDVGTLETGAPYMVMEYLEGSDLSEMLTSQGRPPPGMSVDFILQACEALAEAHALGIVHRDIKPSNFFLTRRADGSPLVKVLDFGISKAPAQGGDLDLTSTQAILGTPAYMSPEQLRSSKQVDARTDIWSLGVVLYQLLSGRRPFIGDTFSELCLKVAMDAVPPLVDVQLPPGLDHIVMRCLDRDLNQRFSNVAELAAALAPFAQTQSVAYSAIERTSRILGARPGPQPGAQPGAAHATGGGSARPSSGYSTPAPTPYPTPTPAPGRPGSTISATSGQMQAGALPSGVHPPRRRRSWLIAAVAILGLSAGITLVAVVGGGSADDSVAGEDGAAPGDDATTSGSSVNAATQPAGQPAVVTPAPAPDASGATSDSSDATGQGDGERTAGQVAAGPDAKDDAQDDPENPDDSDASAKPEDEDEDEAEDKIAEAKKKRQERRDARKKRESEKKASASKIRDSKKVTAAKKKSSSKPAKAPSPPDDDLLGSRK